MWPLMSAGTGIQGVALPLLSPNTRLRQPLRDLRADEFVVPTPYDIHIHECNNTVARYQHIPLYKVYSFRPL